MIDIKIGGPAATKSTDKKKAATGPRGVTGPSFASLLQQAGATTETEASPQSNLNAAYTPLPDATDGQPQSGKQKSTNLLGALNELAEDAFAGQPTAALGKLQSYLATTTADRENLTPAQKEALDEVETRAAVEAEKLKS